MKGYLKGFIIAVTLVIGVVQGRTAQAENVMIRWTGSEDANGSVAHVLSVLSQKLGRPLKAEDFVVAEDRDLAFNHYKRLVQVVDQVPVHGKVIRIWTALKSDKTIQVEANLEKSGTIAMGLTSLQQMGKSALDLRNSLTAEQTTQLVRQSIQKQPDDTQLLGLEWKDVWRGGELFRLAKVRGKRGYHHVWISLRTQEVIFREYREFPQSAQGEVNDLNMPVQVFPVYEEYEGDGTILPRIPAELKYIRGRVPEIKGDIYAPLKGRHYYSTQYDPLLGETEAGRAKGYWATSYLKRLALEIQKGLPKVSNTYDKGVLLQGRFATINIHPDAVKQFSGLNFEPKASASYYPNWVETTVDGIPAEELVPGSAYSGKPIFFADEAWNRQARRLPNHDPVQYMNDGFDEIQVYYAINTLFDSLRTRGFTDPELSTRPFNAFLFNPDIVYRDNAFYTDDTINFTTYSPKQGNAARDNGTIWHELGHGLMDRLMGDQIELADTGGLSEGMADFIAALVVEAVTHGVPFPGSDKFRIINHTGFYLTNEVHDDGEAYGGAMKDFLDAVLKKYGSESGLKKVADVVLETMRLTRDYPGLTAPEWFNHLLFADSLGRPGVREPGELASYLRAALAGRNFSLEGDPVATFAIVNSSTHQEVVPGGPGSRSAPIPVVIPQTGKANFQLEAQVKGSSAFSFHFPVTVKVQHNGGPLQGAIHWDGEETGTKSYVLNSESDTATIPLQVSGACDEVNRPDGSCVDFAYVQVFNQGEDHPVAKKRFYLRVKNRN